MQAGKLRERIEIQQQVEIGAAGGATGSWESIADGARWAAVEPLSGREYFAAQERQAEVSTRIIIRRHDGVRASMRVVHRGQWYEIVSPPMQDYKQAITVLMCNLIEQRPV